MVPVIVHQARTRVGLTSATLQSCTKVCVQCEHQFRFAAQRPEHCYKQPGVWLVPLYTSNPVSLRCLLPTAFVPQDPHEHRLLPLA